MENTVYGLSIIDTAQLHSEDEDFFGSEEASFTIAAVEKGCEDDDFEEIMDNAAFNDDDLEASVSVAVESVVSDGDDFASSSGLVCPETDDEFLKIREKITEGCSCSINCISQFNAEEVFLFRLSLFEMKKSEKDMLILGKLQVLSKGADSLPQHARATKGKRTRITCEYQYDHRHVCKEAFMFLHDVGPKQLKNLQKHLKENGPVPRQHGLTGRVPATTHPFEVVHDAALFIRNFAEVHGLPQPAARSGRAQNPPIFLPASQNYKIVHSKYVEACIAKSPQLRFLPYKSFLNMWRRCLPDIVFMTPRSDVCARCEQFRADVKAAFREEDKIKAMTDFKAHLDTAQEERNYYLTSMKKAETSLANSETDLFYCHYTFDFAEQIHLPHHARQVGPLYFKSPRKVQIFGVCCDANKQQVNYLIDEDKSIGFNGSSTHGPNSVISMLDHYFSVHALREKECHLHCDNCVGQNKNNYVTGYLAWRVITGKNQQITLSFMRVGHTRCLVDGHFGLIKKLYRHSDTDTLEQFHQVVERSSSSNFGQVSGWQWREWDTFFPKFFRRIPQITKYQHFRFSMNSPGVVFAREHHDSEEVTIKLFKKRVNSCTVEGASLPAIISPAGLTSERKKYLYEQVRPYVNAEFQDITCPSPA